MRIYVSSSFRDLKPEREAVLGAIRALGHTEIGMERYGADHRPAAERCAADVRSCDAYVLLVGWRAGSAPADGDGRTYTELEYETALTANLRPLVYLSPGRDAWTDREVDAPGGRVDAFRARVAKAHMPRTFRSATDLVVAVTEDLRLTLGVPTSRASVPELFPYLCDRSAQRTAVRRALRDARHDATWAPVVAVAHGTERQAVDRFLECVRESDLPTVVGGRHRCAGLADVPIAPPHPLSKDPVADLVALLAERPMTFPDVTTAADVEAALGRAAGPVLVRYQVPHDAWSRDDVRCLDAFVALFGRKGLRCPHPVVAFAWAQYREPSGGFLARRRVARINREMRAAVEGLAPRALVLPELHDVTRDDVEAWMRDPTHPPHLPRPSRDAVRDLFGGAPGLPMEAVGEGLRAILDRSVEAEGVRQ